MLHYHEKHIFWKNTVFGILRRVALVRTDVSEERVAFIINPSSSNHYTMMMEAIYSSETSILTRATLRKIQEDGILHSNRCENIKSCIALICWAL
jgi:hypothetical protein